jgi:hypothetical protein
VKLWQLVTFTQLHIRVHTSILHSVPVTSLFFALFLFPLSLGVKYCAYFVGQKCVCCFPCFIMMKCCADPSSSARTSLNAYLAGGSVIIAKTARMDPTNMINAVRLTFYSYTSYTTF